MTIWHDDDAFWTEMEPFMFTPERWATTPQEVDQLEALLALHPPATMLDLGCGPGRHTLELARRGYKVTGVDRTAVYLARAREAAARERLQVDLIEADLRDFESGPVFDVALNLFTTFGYFADPAQNQRLLQTACAALRPGGRLVLELMGKELLARIFRDRTWVELEDGSLLLEERRLSKAWSWIDNRWIKIHGTTRREFELGHWLYSAAELAEMLRQAGFAAVDIYGALDGRPYDHEATRLVAVACK